jgi:Kef-type K+ transport system membrane component KefB
MFASHTLLTYPIVSKAGITKNVAVSISIGGTMISVVGALLILAVIAGSSQGDIDNNFWTRLVISVIIFGVIVVFGFPIICSWFFKKFNDNVVQYIFVLGMVFLASFLAKLAGLDGIIGAFLSGLVLNRFIPRTSPLMNRIDFVGNALFIPFFLIGVGMLIDFKAIFSSFDGLIVIISMTVFATISKYLPAKITQKLYKFTKAEGDLIFGLSNSQAAATLAAVLIGYNIILDYTPDGLPIRLLDDYVLNGTIIMILITCATASFVTQKAAFQIAKDDLLKNPAEISNEKECTLIGLANDATSENLIQFSINTIEKKLKPNLFGLHVITSNKENTETINKGQNILEKAEKFASGADYKLIPLLRYDINIASGIINTVKEKNIKHFYIGLHEKSSIVDSFLGSLTIDLLKRCSCSIFVQRSIQPLNTIKKYILVIPPNAQFEVGFFDWFHRIINISSTTGITIKIFGNADTLFYIRNLKINQSAIYYSNFDNYDDFLIISREVTNDTMLLLNIAREGGISYNQTMKKIPHYLNNYFLNSNFVIIYPSSNHLDTISNDLEDVSHI